MGKKGVSPLIAVILLLVITVAMAGSIMVFLRGTLTKLQSQVGESVGGTEVYSIRILDISTCTWNGTTLDMTIYFRNEGKTIPGGTPITLVIRDEDGNNLVTKIDDTSLLPNDCERDKTCTITLSGESVTVAPPYYLYISIKGNDFTYTFDSCAH